MAKQLNGKTLADLAQVVLANTRDVAAVSGVHAEAAAAKGLLPAYDLSPGDPPVDIHYDPAPSGSRRKRLCVVGDGMPALGKLLEEYNAYEPIRARVGEGAVGAVVTQTVLDLSRRDTPPTPSELAGVMMRASREMLAHIRPYRAVIPISNLRLVRLPELRVGDVTVRPKESARAVVEDTFARLRDGETGETESPRHLHIFDDPGHDYPSYASVVVEAEWSRVPQMAEERVEQAVQLLRFVSGWVPGGRAERPRIGNPGEQVQVHESSVFWYDESTGDGGGISRLLDSPWPFTFSDGNLKVAREHSAFDQLSAVLAKEHADWTPMERSVVVAIRWLGRSIDAKTVADRVIALATAMEALLAQGGAGGISETIAMRLAFLAGRDAEERKFIYRSARDFYGWRCRLVHGEDADRGPSVDLNLIETWYGDALVGIAERLPEGYDHRAMEEWVRDQMFEVPAHGSPAG